MLPEDLLDLKRWGVDAAGLDHFLQSSAKASSTIRFDRAKVTGRKTAIPVLRVSVIRGSVHRHQFEGGDRGGAAGDEPVDITPSPHEIGKMRGKRVAGLAGGDDHPRICGGG